MSAICYKPKSKPMPSVGKIREMWVCHPNGAGVMWREEDGIHFKKGFMKFDDFLNFLVEADLAEKEVALHFLSAPVIYATPENTNPFAIDSSADSLAFEGVVSGALMNDDLYATIQRDRHETKEFARRVGESKNPVKFLSSASSKWFNSCTVLLFGSDGTHMFGKSFETGDDGLFYANRNSSLFKLSLLHSFISENDPKETLRDTVNAIAKQIERALNGDLKRYGNYDTVLRRLALMAIDSEDGLILSERALWRYLALMALDSPEFTVDKHMALLDASVLVAWGGYTVRITDACVKGTCGTCTAEQLFSKKAHDELHKLFENAWKKVLGKC